MGARGEGDEEEGGRERTVGLNGRVSWKDDAFGSVRAR